MLKAIQNKIIFGALSCALLPLFAATAQADEKSVLAACEKQLCALVVNKKAEGETLSCNLVKTWGSKDITSGSLGKKWSWGDAKCSVKINLPTGPLVEALTADKKELATDAAKVECQIGSGEKKDTLTFSMSPKLTFEKGIVTAVNLGIANVDGPFMQKWAIKSASWVGSSSVFQKPAVKEVNRFLKKCPSKVK